MYRRLALLIGGLVLLGTAPLWAQDAVLSQMYGNGVHAYFAQEYQQAYGSFTTAINAGCKDPRCYYFRGLSYLRLGREEEARTDFDQGAKLETAVTDQFFNVAKSLERVQGQDRMLLESYRGQARMAAFQRSEDLRKARYESLRREESRVLQRQAESGPKSVEPAAAVPAVEKSFESTPAPRSPAEAARTPTPEPGKTPPVPAPADQDPFAEGAKAKPAAEKPAAAKPVGADDPFALEPAKPAAPAAAMPAAPAEAKPAEPAAPGAAAAGRKADVAADDIFGAGGAEKPMPKEAAADKDKDLMGADAAGDTSAKKTAGKKASGKKVAAKSEDEADPFAAEEKPAKKATKKAAADESDPFGMAEEKPATKAKPKAKDESDPFGAAEEKPAKKGAAKAADDSDPFGMAEEKPATKSSKKAPAKKAEEE